MITKTISVKEKQKLAERLDDLMLAELIEHRFNGPFVNANDLLKKIDRRKDVRRE